MHVAPHFQVHVRYPARYDLIILFLQHHQSALACHYYDAELNAQLTGLYHRDAQPTATTQAETHLNDNINLHGTPLQPPHRVSHG